jgi:hypothetical protein
MVVSLAAILGALCFNALRRRPFPVLLALGLLCYGASYLGLWRAGSVASGALASSLGQFASSIVLPAMIAWTLASFPPEHRGRGAGLWGAMFFAGQFVSAPLLTGLERLTGSLAAAFGLLGVAALGAACITLWIHRPSAAADA